MPGKPIDDWTVVDQRVPFPIPHGLIREILATAGMTQAAAARAINVRRDHFRRWVMDPSKKSYRKPDWAAIELLRRMILCGEVGNYSRQFE